MVTADTFSRALRPYKHLYNMALDPLLVLELVALGVVSGFLAGLLGIGGGMVMVPFLTLIMSARGAAPDMAVKMAIATSMATIVFTSISSVRAHHRKGAVRWDIVRGLAPGIVVGSLISSLGLFALLKGSSLAIFLACLWVFPRPRCFWTKSPSPAGKCRLRAGSGLPVG